MNYRGSFCEPFSPDIIELGDIREEDIIDKFESINWVNYLKQMEGMKEEEIHYSPSLEIENKDTRHGLSISAVGDPNTYEFYIFYKRPKLVTKLFGLVKNLDENFLSDRTGQTSNDVRDAVTALINDDLTVLEKRWG